MGRLILILIFITFFSCNSGKEKEKNIEGNIIKDENVDSKSLKAVFSFKTNREDIFKIMMDEIEVTDLQSKSIHIIEEMPPTTDYEKIEAEFEANTISDKLLISLGNKEVKVVEIDFITVSFGEKIIVAETPEELNNFFYFNKFIDFTSTSKTVKTQKVDGLHVPIIGLRKKAIDRLTGGQ